MTHGAGTPAIRVPFPPFPPMKITTDAGLRQYVKTNMRDKPDGILCICGNETHIDGFYPADARRGKLVSPEIGSGWDGYTIACLSCGICINTHADVARPLPTNGKWDWSWEHPLCGWVPVPDDPDSIPGL